MQIRPYERTVGRVLRGGVAAMVLSGVLGLAGGAHAAPWQDPNSEPPSKRVFLGDLNLSREAGAVTALQRIRGAARSVCRQGIDVTALSHMADYRACVAEASRTAVGRLDNPLVTSLGDGYRRPGSTFASRR